MLALEETMTRICCVVSLFIFASTALAQTPAHFIYRCTVSQGVSVQHGGALSSDQEVQDYGRRISPIVLDTETGQTKLGTILIDSTYEIINHGSMMEGLQAFDTAGGLGTVLIIRVDLPQPYRMFATFAGNRVYGGTCERTPKNPG